MDKKLIIVSTAVFLTFLVYIFFVLMKNPIGSLTRAASLANRPSDAKSLIFAWPLMVKANDKKGSDITIFVRDTEGHGLSQQRVVVKTTVGTVTPAENKSDTDGKAIFTLTSDTIGTAQLEAYINETKLNKSVSVKFN